jgi:hypothetical protein
MINSDSIKPLHKQPTEITAPATPDTALASKVASQSSFGLQAVGCFAHCITTEWSTFFRGAKLFTGVAEHLAEVGYHAIRAAQTANNVPLLKSGVAETGKVVDDVLGTTKVISLSELGELVSERSGEILGPVTKLATAKALEPLFSQAEKSFGHLIYALSVNSGKIAGLNRFLQLMTLLENQAQPQARVIASLFYETYLCVGVLQQSLQSSGLVGKIVKLGALLAACECVHKVSLAWKQFKQNADKHFKQTDVAPAPPSSSNGRDPQLATFFDRISAARTVFWIHRLVSLVQHPVRTGWVHALGLAAASALGGAS